MKSSLAFSTAALALALNAQAAVVFQADFNGTGSGTGGASDLVTFGGTGTINNVNPGESNVTVSIGSSTPLAPGAGSYLSLNDQGAHSVARVAGINFVPTSAANSFDSWYTNANATLGWDTMNGGVDFLFRTSSSADLTTNTMRMLDINGGSSGYRLAISSVGTDRFIIQFLQAGTAFLSVYTNGPTDLVANQTYHFALTLSTDVAGKLTINAYLAAGNTAIDTTSTAQRIGTGTSTAALDAGATGSISSAFGSSSGFNFGQLQNSDADVKVLDYDRLRIFDSVPASFDVSSIPEPGSFAAVMGAQVGIGACVRRRRR